MDSKPHDRSVPEIVQEALLLDPSQRDAFVVGACADDAGRLAEVRSLLEASSRAGAFMADPTAASDVVHATVVAPSREGPGTQIGPYRLVHLIGEGGFGSVFLAEQQYPVARRVALKVIKLGMDTRAVIARFEAERQALAIMDHPSIAKVFDAGATDSGRPYFVMELVKGEPITDYCDRNNLSVAERLQLFQQVCHAVQHAHQKGIIHRDIKPSNVMITQHDGRPVPKVIDFGIAKATSARLTEKTLYTELHQIIGTPEYMSPEQAEMSGLDIDTRSDVYSLGVLLYELLTGTTPFDSRLLRSAAYAEICRIIREVTPHKPSTRLSTLDVLPSVAARRHTEPRKLSMLVRGDLDWIVMKALEKDRTRRYETASGLATDIQRYLAHEPVSAGPPGVAYRMRKFVRRNRTSVLTAGAFIIALFLGTIIAAAGWLAAERAEQLERRQRELAVQTLAEISAKAGIAMAETNDWHTNADGGEIEALRDAALKSVDQFVAQRNRADALALAERQRADELQRVSDFQARMLSDIDIDAMGAGLKQRYRQQVKAGLERESIGEFPDRRMRTTEEVAAELAAYDQRSDAAQGADVARGMLDAYVLEPSVGLMQSQFADQPLVQAALMDATGRVYYGLAMFHKAQPLLRSALEIRRRELGPEHHLVADSLQWLGASLRSGGDFAAAEPLLNEALEIRRHAPEPDELEVANCADDLAWVYQLTGRYTVAQPLFQEALDRRKRRLGQEHLKIAKSTQNLAWCLQSQGDLVASETLHREALAMRRRLEPADNRALAASIDGLAGVLFAKGDYAGAEPLYREALAMRRRVLGDEHVTVADSLNNVANLLRVRGDNAGAEQMLREALEMRRRAFGDDNVLVAAAINNLSLVLHAKGDYPAAERMMREALAINRRLSQPSQVAAILCNLVAVLQAQGRHDEAEAPAREALAIDRQMLGPDSPDLSFDLANLASVLNEQHKLEEAERLYREALAIDRKYLGNDHIQVASTLEGLAATLLKKGDAASAVTLSRESLEIHRHCLGDRNATTARSMNNLGGALLAAGELGSAESMFREALAIDREILGEDHMMTQAPKIGLGRALLRRGQFEAAEGMLLDVAARCENSQTLRGRWQPRLADACVELYEAWHAARPSEGHDAKAAEWREHRTRSPVVSSQPEK